MVVDLTIIRRLALEKGLSINYISKEDKLSYILLQLSKILDNKFVLKGGTALNRAYLQEKNFNRFSEDLDIDFISNISLSQKIRKIENLMERIEGFELNKPRLLHRTLRFDCGYVNELRSKDKVRIEFYLSQSKLIAARKVKPKLLKSSFIETNPSMFNVYSFEDLLARKLVALYRREDGKDVYDVYYGLELEYENKILKKALRMLLSFYKIDLSQKDFLNKLSGRLNDYKENSERIGNSTNHFIPKVLRPNWKMMIDGLIMKIERLRL